MPKVLLSPYLSALWQTFVTHTKATESGSTIKMSIRLGMKIRKWVLQTHRWTGIAFCLLFLMWFLSGIVLMYVPYPELKPAERLVHMRPLDGLSFAISPFQAASATGMRAIQEVGASSLLDRPVYRFRSGTTNQVVFADTGERFHGFKQDEARQVAAEWLGQSQSDIYLEQKMTQEDQWTVTGRYCSLRPLWKFAGSSGQVGLCLRCNGRGGAAHRPSLTLGILLWSDSSLDLLHTTS
jgi:hypothetical protein